VSTVSGIAVFASFDCFSPLGKWPLRRLLGGHNSRDASSIVPLWSLAMIALLTSPLTICDPGNQTSAARACPQLLSVHFLLCR
jgi:hypothetical protein